MKKFVINGQQISLSQIDEVIKADLQIEIGPEARKNIIKCRDYLENEFALIKPKIICLLGATAYKTILNGSEISKHHGKLVNKDGRNYFITFHPAAIIYNQKLNLGLELERNTLKVCVIIEIFGCMVRKLMM